VAALLRCGLRTGVRPAHTIAYPPPVRERAPLAAPPAQSGPERCVSAPRPAYCQEQEALPPRRAAGWPPVSHPIVPVHWALASFEASPAGPRETGSIPICAESGPVASEGAHAGPPGRRSAENRSAAPRQPNPPACASISAYCRRRLRGRLRILASGQW